MNVIETHEEAIMEWRLLKTTVRGGTRYYDETPRNAQVMVAIAEYPDEHGFWRWVKAVARCDEFGIPRTSYCYGGTIWYWAPMPEDPPREVVQAAFDQESAAEAKKVELQERELLASLQQKYGTG